MYDIVKCPNFNGSLDANGCCANWQVSGVKNSKKPKNDLGSWLLYVVYINLVIWVGGLGYTVSRKKQQSMLLIFICFLSVASGNCVFHDALQTTNIDSP